MNAPDSASDQQPLEDSIWARHVHTMKYQWFLGFKHWLGGYNSFRQWHRFRPAA
jgi:hypothetical protein